MRVSKLPKREIDVCGRLRQAREGFGITHQECALRIGIPRTTLINYELGRSPVRVDVGLRFCRNLIVSEEWLATGRFDAMTAAAVGKTVKGDLSSLETIFFRQCLDLLSEPLANQIPIGMLFSEAYDTLLRPRYEQLATVYTHEPRIIFTEADSPQLGETWIRVMLERYSKLIGNEALRLNKSQKQAQFGFFRYLFESNKLIFRRFMGQSTPKIPAFIKTLVASPNKPIGPLHAGEAPAPRVPEFEFAIKE